MDVLNNLNIKSNDCHTNSDFDKSIKIKHIKDKNRSKTCVHGIFNFMTEKEADALIKIIKKKLGCSGIISDEVVILPSKTKKADDSQKIMIFSGNHIQEIRSILLEMKVTDKSLYKSVIIRNLFIYIIDIYNVSNYCAICCIILCLYFYGIIFRKFTQRSHMRERSRLFGKYIRENTFIDKYCIIYRTQTITCHS